MMHLGGMISRGNSWDIYMRSMSAGQNSDMNIGREGSTVIYRRLFHCTVTRDLSEKIARSFAGRHVPWTA
jgi:hypothetical protein